jgi:hypothetical protein
MYQTKHIWLCIKKEFTALVLIFLIVFPPTLKVSLITPQILKEPEIFLHTDSFYSPDEYFNVKNVDN